MPFLVAKALASSEHLGVPDWGFRVPCISRSHSGGSGELCVMVSPRKSSYVAQTPMWISHMDFSCGLNSHLQASLLVDCLSF